MCDQPLRDSSEPLLCRQGEVDDVSKAFDGVILLFVLIAAAIILASAIAIFLVTWLI